MNTAIQILDLRKNRLLFAFMLYTRCFIWLLTILASVIHNSIAKDLLPGRQRLNLRLVNRRLRALAARVLLTKGLTGRLTISVNLVDDDATGPESHT